MNLHRLDAEARACCVFRLSCPDAGQVFLMGSFNNWSTTATPMEPRDGGRWEVAVDLMPGRYPYCYFVIAKGWGVSGDRQPLTSFVNVGAVVEVPVEHGGPRVVPSLAGRAWGPLN